MRLDELQAIIQDRGYDPRQTPKGFRCRCPGHDDQNPSLDVAAGQDGRILLTCRSAGCKPEEILKPLGLLLRDLFPEPLSPKYPSAKAELSPDGINGSKNVLTVRQFADAKRLLDDFLRAAGLQDHGTGVIFPYGTGLRKRLRTSMHGEKRFAWMNGPEPIGAYTAEILPFEFRPSGRPMELCPVDRSFILIVEGESDALTCWNAGFPCVGLPGAQQTAKLLLSHLDGFNSVGIWREPGLGGGIFAEGVANRLKAVGFVGTVRVIASATDKDVSDLWNRLEADKEAFSSELSALIANAKPYQAGAGKPIPATGGLITSNLGDTQVKPTHWLVPNLIPSGMLTLVAGHGGAGKSSLLAHLVACVTQGRCAFGIEYPEPLSSDVLVYNCEDAPAEVMIPRLMAAGAKINRIRRLTGATGPDGKPIPFSLLHVDQLEAEFEKEPFKLFVIDPISSVTGNASADDNSETDVRPLLESLALFAERTGVSVIGVKHLGKGMRDTAALRTLGSVAYTSVPRMVLSLTADPDDDTRRILARAKTNLPVKGDKGFAFGQEPLPNALDLILELARTGFKTRVDG